MKNLSKFEKFKTINRMDYEKDYDNFGIGALYCAVCVC